MKRSLAIIMALLAISPALAQTDLLNSGKNALQSLGGTKPGGSNSALGAGLSDGEISTGLKDALRVGTQKAVATVGHPGGFLNDKQVHIPLPGPLAQVKSGLTMVGAGGMADDLEQRINKAAETAAPQAAGIFGDAVGRMSIQDARGILTGPQDSATQYFKRTTTPQLTQAMKPIVDQSLSGVGALQSYNALVEKAKTMPLASGVDLDLSSYVVGKTLDGIFFYVAKQEADIRANPAARSTDALRAVFR
ncbi:MAG TPA: DUF4197 domain-containing protein [Aliidongia sp.]|nr:DUF4197 domain-containing protein [Aliidongia sp.]